jgi:hypothetical protein
VSEFLRFEASASQKKMTSHWLPRLLYQPLRIAKKKGPDHTNDHEMPTFGLGSGQSTRGGWITYYNLAPGLQYIGQAETHAQNLFSDFRCFR